jgi:hypothetical protein
VSRSLLQTHKRYHLVTAHLTGCLLVLVRRVQQVTWLLLMQLL